ncbi:ThuA domain-containing protein [Nonomuraea sp. NPDC050547]|uniref:ThuA domain-containing protein n=1 Tax=Nonomuraea sp. NPDC050547 TaxID=3364368 RepID=UPI0037B56D0A
MIRQGTVLLCAIVLSSAWAVAPAYAHEAIDPADYQRVELAKGVPDMGEPMSMAVLPDLSVIHTARDGTLRRTDRLGDTKVLGALSVYNHDEEGLQGVAADPGFATNRTIYLYYAPRLSTPAGDAPATGTDWSAWQGVNRLSRFTVKPDWTLDVASEKKVLDVPADRGMCCHVGGDIDFDAQGNLYLSTGDDSNPFDSAGYAPLDERTNRNPAYDAQRTAGNTNDLRGKILRITVNPATGAYVVPSGNMFAPGTARTRPEIYAMGFRNPFRMSVDKTTGVIYVGDYGPDAGSTDPGRGPSGQVEFDKVGRTGNYGWPYCTGTNTAAETYNEYTFPSGPSGATYDCAGGPANNSFRNTGLSTLPAALPAWIRYGGDAGSPPEFGTGSESPMGGPVYHYDPLLNSAVKFPEELDNMVFLGEFGRRWIKAVSLADNHISAFPWTGTQVMDLAFGPDGSLYVLDYGTGYFGGDANSALYRIEYVKGRDRNPVARVAADKTSGQPPLTVAFSSAGSADPDGQPLTYAWDFGDGATSTEPNPTHTYTAKGTHSATLVVEDPGGNSGTSSVPITVGNTAPAITFQLPREGQLFEWGDTVPFKVTVTDPEDGAVDCATVLVSYVLGHDSHGHPITSTNGCEGTLTIPTDGEHDSAANIFAVFNASYTDDGNLTTGKSVTLQPRHRQAEHYTNASGIGVYNKAAAEGGKTVGDIHAGDWIPFTPYELSSARSATFRVSSGGAGGTVEIRTGSQTGPVAGRVAVPQTGSWETFVDVRAALTGLTTATTGLFLVFTGGTGALFDVDSFTLSREAVAQPVTGPIGGPGGCVDVAGANPADRTKVQMYACNQSAAQRWTIDPGPGTVKALGKCMDVAGANPADGTRVQIYTCNATAAQKWTVDAGAFKALGKCLDATDRAQLVIRACNGGAAQRFSPPTPAAGDLLVFSRTAGFRHDSIPAGIQAIRNMGYAVTATEDPAAFTGANLAGYKAVVFLNTTGDVLNAQQQAAFEGYIKSGGGYAGVHAAADTEYDWPFYGELAGAWFASHPAIQQARINVGDRAHAATAHLGATVTRTDEWYNFRTNPRPAARVLATLDETSYTGGTMGGDHPISWCKVYQGGRSFYTGLGHTVASYSEPAFLQHLKGGIAYAMGAAQADCRPETGYTTLYNGSVTGWEQAGPGSFTNADATLTSTGGMGLYWYKAKQYTGGYSLKLDWRMAGDDNSGVFIGFPASTDPWSAVNNGYEIQIDATDAADRTTGSVYGFKAADIAARDRALNPPGQWNTFEIKVEGERVQVFLNGVKINDYTNADPARSLKDGHIGLQNHGTGDTVSFRNVRITE